MPKPKPEQVEIRTTTVAKNGTVLTLIKTVPLEEKGKRDAHTKNR